MSAARVVKTILVVDDDNIFHFLMKKALARLGIPPDSIQTALSGKEALDLLLESNVAGIPSPDIILLDLNMPMMGGFEFLEAYKKLPFTDDAAKTKIIIISSSLNDRDVDRALQLGASHYLAKPVSDTELEKILT